METAQAARQAAQAACQQEHQQQEHVQLDLDELAEIQRQRQQEMRQQAPIWSPQHARCGRCDDCLKGYPCLVASLDTEQPGAFAVQRDSANTRGTRRRRSSVVSPAAGAVSIPPPRGVRSSLSMDSSHTQQSYGSTAQTRRSTYAHLLQSQQPYSSPPELRSQSTTFSTNSSEFMAVAVKAVVVNDDENDMSFSTQERQLRRQQAELEQQEAQLRAWQEELEQQRLSLEQQNHSHHHHQNHSSPSNLGGSDPSNGCMHNHSSTSIVSASSSIVVTAVPEETFERGELGSGPLRFAPQQNYMRSSQACLLGLDTNMLEKVRQLEQKWSLYKLKSRNHNSHSHSSHSSSQAAAVDLTPQWHMRFLWFYAHQSSTDGSYKFPLDKVWKAEKKLKPRFVNLNVATLGPQLYSKTLFPVPGLKTRGGHDMFYMRPSRYFPNYTPTKTIIDNLCYVMNTMLESSAFAQKEGIGFVACMDNWKMKNFEINYCYQFMMALQGMMVPVKTQLFLIVNPPSWFGVIWKIMKPMLAPSFRKRVKICPEFKIAKYLAPGYEEYLPDDMRSGKANTDQMVVDFIAYRQYVEQGQVTHNINISNYQQRNNNRRRNSSYHVGVGGGGAAGMGDYSISSTGDDCDEDDAESISRGDLSSNQDLTASYSTGMMNSSTASRFSATSSDGDHHMHDHHDDHIHDDHHDEEDDDGASIHCDIDDEDALHHDHDDNDDDHDVKPPPQSSSSMGSTVHISNMPSL